MKKFHTWRLLYLILWNGFIYWICPSSIQWGHGSLLPYQNSELTLTRHLSDEPLSPTMLPSSLSENVDSVSSQTKSNDDTNDNTIPLHSDSSDDNHTQPLESTTDTPSLTQHDSSNTDSSTLNSSSPNDNLTIISEPDSPNTDSSTSSQRGTSVVLFFLLVLASSIASFSYIYYLKVQGRHRYKRVAS